MKKFIKIVFVILIIAICFVAIDAGTAFLRKKAPLIHWSGEIENGKVDHALAYDIYYCYNLGELKTTEWVLKKKEYTCPPSDIILKEENLNTYFYKGFFNKKKYIKKIETKEDLKNAVRYIKPFNKKYADEFFEKKAIIIAYFPEGANSVVSFDQVIISNTIVVNFNVEKARVDKDNSTGYAYFIEIDKEYLGDKSLTLES